PEPRSGRLRPRVPGRLRDRRRAGAGRPGALADRLPPGAGRPAGPAAPGGAASLTAQRPVEAFARPDDGREPSSTRALSARTAPWPARAGPGAPPPPAPAAFPRPPRPAARPAPA